MRGTAILQEAALLSLVEVGQDPQGHKGRSICKRKGNTGKAETLTIKWNKVTSAYRLSGRWNYSRLCVARRVAAQVPAFQGAC